MPGPRPRVKGTIRPLRNDILVRDIEGGYGKTESGIILPDDLEFREENIKPRFAKVWKVGKDVQDVKPGQWILIYHGRWTYGIEVEENGETFLVHKVDPNYILLVTDDYEPKRRRRLEEL